MAIEILLLTLEIFGIVSSLAGLGEILTKHKQVKIKKLTRAMERIDRNDLMGILIITNLLAFDRQIDQFVAHRSHRFNPIAILALSIPKKTP